MDSKFTIFLSGQIEKLAIEIEVERGKLLSLSIAEDASINDHADYSNNGPANELIEFISKQLKNYFSSVISFQSIPIEPQGTLFQKSVWNELIKIPPGETRTYGEIANTLNSSPRAVGNACRKNPIQIIVPCHRVVSAKGLGGYAGKTEGKQLDIKHWLLNHEGVAL